MEVDLLCLEIRWSWQMYANVHLDSNKKSKYVLICINSRFQLARLDLMRLPTIEERAASPDPEPWWMRRGTGLGWQPHGQARVIDL